MSGTTSNSTKEHSFRSSNESNNDGDENVCTEGDKKEIDLSPDCRTTSSSTTIIKPLPFSNTRNEDNESLCSISNSSTENTSRKRKDISNNYIQESKKCSVLDSLHSKTTKDDKSYIVNDCIYSAFKPIERSKNDMTGYDHVQNEDNDRFFIKFLKERNKKRKIWLSPRKESIDTNYYSFDSSDDEKDMHMCMLKKKGKEYDNSDTATG